MTEVSEFLSETDLIGNDLSDFAMKYERLSDVWTHCERPDWLLNLLDIYCRGPRDYRYNGGIESYIDLLKEMTALHDSEPNDLDEHHFSYRPAVSSIKDEVESGAISRFEGDRRCFVWLWSQAFEATRFVFNNESNRFEFNKFADKIIAEQAGMEPILNASNELDFKRNILKKQSDLLKAAIANPFH